MRFTGCCISYDECENGNYELELDEDLLEEHCYYNVVWDAEYKQLEGYKFETDENGNRVIYVINEYDFPKSELDNIDSYWTIYYPEEEEEGDQAQRVAKASIEDYEEGNHSINFTDGDWSYRGEINIHIEPIDKGDTIIYEKFIKAFIEVEWHGNDRYRYTHPADNYEFPIGMMCYGTSYAIAEAVNVNVVFWNNEAKEWIFSNSGGDFVKHYEKNGKIIQEAAQYTFNGETMRMEIIPETKKTTIYSYDDAARLSTIEYKHTNHTTHFEYLGETNYLQKEYTTDARGNESDICTYYYSIGKYLWPVTNATSIDEVAATGIAINGNSITANGNINVFTPSGSLVASGNGNVTINGKGLYIVEAGGKVHKILIK